MEARKFLCIFVLGAFFSVATKYSPLRFYLVGGGALGEAKNSKYELTPQKRRLSEEDVNDLEKFYKEASKHHNEGHLNNAFRSYSTVASILSKSLYADSSFSEATKLQPKPLLSKSVFLRINYEISMGRGAIRHEQGLIKEALSFFVQASKFNDKDTPLLSLISHLAIKVKDFQLANAMYIKWIDLDPHNPEPWYFFAVHLEKNHNGNRSEESLEKYLEAMSVLKKSRVPKLSTIKSLPPSSTSSRFLIWNAVYHSIGRLLRSMGRDEAAEVYYKEGSEIGLWSHPMRRFVSMSRRPIYDSLPYVSSTNRRLFPAKTVELLESHYIQLKRELSGLLNIVDEYENGADHSIDFKIEKEALHTDGEWKQLRIYENRAYNYRKLDLCRVFKKGCLVFDQIIADNNKKCELSRRNMVSANPESNKGDPCMDLMIYYSKLSPNTTISPHCGPTFRRLRIHLGISIPEPDMARLHLKANNKKYTWKEGKAFVFDDSFEHSVDHRGLKDRIVLVVDVVHPNEYLAA